MYKVYKLTLTAGERRAIDWVGDRYGHGYDLFFALWCCSEAKPDHVDWDDPHTDIQFTVVEPTAWKIQEIGQECEYRWDCFSAELSQKLTNFCLQIV